MASDTGIETMNHERNDEKAPTRDFVVARPFTLTKDDGERLSFGVGTHKDTPCEVADHWYSKLHEAKEGQDPPVASSAHSDKEHAARVAAEDEAQRLRVISQRATDDLAAAQLEIAQKDQELETLRAENVALKDQIETLRVENETPDETEETTDDVHVYRKGRKWFVRKGEEQIGEYASKDAADEKAAELRGAV